MIPTLPLMADPSILSLLLDADIVVQFVLVSLVGMSIWCWVIILAKQKSIGLATQQSAAFLELFWNSRRLDQIYERAGDYPDAPVAEVFKAGYIELNKLSGDSGSIADDLGATENVARSLRRASRVELMQLERRIPFLATTGSTAPFIGLLGTVWGILRAFQKIGITGQASMQTVGPDIAHALIATAMGLAAAIPAVMAYNYFVNRLRILSSEMDNFSNDFLNIVKRHFRAG
jgi:biopolymer transport protein TolQ